MYGKGYRVFLGVGPSDPRTRLWIEVMPKTLVGIQIPHGVGGELRWRP